MVLITNLLTNNTFDVFQPLIASLPKPRGFEKAWRARNCDRLKSKTDRKICLRNQRKQCCIKLDARLEREDRNWPKRKIVFSCKKRQKRDRCINYLLKDNNMHLKTILIKRHHIKNYNSINLKRMAKQVCKKKVSKMRYKYYVNKMNVKSEKSLKRHSKKWNYILILVEFHWLVRNEWLWRPNYTKMIFKQDCVV